MKNFFTWKYIFSLLLPFILFFSHISNVFSADAIGRVLIGTGNFSAVTGSNQQRALSRGSPVYQGDTLTTDASGNGQVQFNDGSLISIPPNTRYRVNNYAYQAKKKKASYSATLLRGGVKSLSGAIAKLSPQNSRTSSRVATIGIRGTFWETALEQMNQAAGAYDGSIQFTTTAGNSIAIGQGTSFQFVQLSPSGQPQGTNEIPQLLVSTFDPRVSDFKRDIQQIKLKEEVILASVSPFGSSDPTLQGPANNPFEITTQDIINSAIASMLPGAVIPF